MGDRGSKKAYAGQRTGIYLPTKLVVIDQSWYALGHGMTDRHPGRQTNRME